MSFVSKLIVGLSRGLDSFTTYQPASVLDSPRALALRAEAAQIRDVVARVRALKAAGVTREQLLAQAAQQRKTAASRQPRSNDALR